jgi:hypothetical protein
VREPAATEKRTAILLTRVSAGRANVLSSLLILLLTPVILASSPTFAQPDAGFAEDSSNTAETAASDEDSDDNIITRTMAEIEHSNAWRWLEARRDGVSENVSVVGRNLDDWLAGEGIGERSNESYMRIRINQRVGRFNSYHSNARIGGSIDLPRATERWKLIFESENTERDSLRDQRLNNVSTTSFTGGFRYEHPERNGWRFNHDIGMRAKIPLDPFYRFRVRYDVDLSDDWYAGFSTRIFYYNNDGWGQDTRVFFTRILTEELNFRIESEVNYQHDERLTEFSQSVALYQALGERETMTYEVGLIGQNRPVATVDHYFMQMVYRKAIYEDWLVLELVPQLLAEHEYDWKPDPRVQLNLEIYFFDF